jgi:hypothetical protein
MLNNEIRKKIPKKKTYQSKKKKMNIKYERRKEMEGEIEKQNKFKNYLT